MRLDVTVGEKFACTRNKAQSYIKDGLVLVNNILIRKPSYEITGSEEIKLREDKKIHWVSRSAGKLDGFLDSLRISSHELRITNAYCLDVGSSTGGFTQVLLERGARHVDAVDVGTDQLHPSIKDDSRVSSFEQTDIRDFVTRNSGFVNRSVPSDYELGVTSYDLIVCDASFISLHEILPSILRFANENTAMILLWKPQFEVGKSHLRKTGVPKDEKIVENQQKTWENFLLIHHCKIFYKEKSRVIGEAGNQEWLYLIQRI